MEITPTAIADVLIIRPKKFEDARGFFSEVFRESEAATWLPSGARFVQDNQSLSVPVHTWRGLHYQEPPFAQAKLVRVLQGAILDFAVDIRQGSPSFGQHVAVELRAKDFTQLLVPEGFAHGFLTLEPHTEVFYKVTNPYSQKHDKGVIWSDPALNIQLPVPSGQIILSDKDKNQPLLKDAGSPFIYKAKP